MSRIRSALGSIDFKKLRKEADALLKLPAKKREKIEKVLGRYQSKKDLDKFEDQVMKDYEKADRPLTSLDKSRAKGFGISTKNKAERGYNIVLIYPVKTSRYIGSGEIPAV